jgi:vancomycin resistance protein YoaR
VWWIVGAVVAVPLVLYVIGLVVQGGGIARGTTVEGVAIGGLDRDAAVARLEQELAPRLKDDLTLQHDGTDVVIIPTKAGIALDASATVDSASMSGRDPLSVIRGLFGAAPAVEPVTVVDQDELAGATGWVAKKLDRTVREGAIRFEGESFTEVAPRAGRTLDRDAAASAITAAAVAEQRTVAAPVTTTDPTITAEAVDAAARGFATAAVSAPVTVTVDGGDADATASVEVDVERFTPYLSTTATDGALRLVVDGEGLRKELSPSLGGIETEARDATFRIVGGTPEVVASRDGRSVPAKELAAAFAAAVSSNDDREATVELSTTKANLTTADARALGVVERVSRFRQPFPYAAYRYQNIGQAAERIDGTLLLPGETFSMNDTALERTPENGYTEGFVIQGGRLVEELGGGVSTITTAMWDAAFYAGLERVEQRAHSFYISRYKPGLEATVAWGQLDLKFKNDTEHGVFITAERGRNFVTVSMYSTKTRDVEAEFGPRTNSKPFKKVVDTSAKCSPQSGVNGFTIVVTRVIREDGVVVKREPLKTVYKPAANVTCRPAATPKPSTPPTTAPPTAAPSTPKATPTRRP